jgi:oligoendopeptidase F
MTTPAATWDLTSFFPQFDGPEYRSFRDGLRQRLAELHRRAGDLRVLRPDNLEPWTQLLLDMERAYGDFAHLSSYLGCLRAADTADEAVRREEAALDGLVAEYKKLEVPVLAAFKEADEGLFETLLAHPDLQSVAYQLRRMRHRARFTMDPELEDLAADLEVDGSAAWFRLYNQIAGRLEFEVEMADGTRKKVSMALKNSLLEDPDPKVRKSALEGSNAAWATMEDVAAQALNAINGTRLKLNQRRGVEHFLDQALFDSAVGRRTLETLMGVLRDKRGVPQEYLRLKARLLGRDRLGFQDLSAPLPLKGTSRMSWEEATRTVLDSFGRSYPGLQEYTRVALERRWIDSEARPNRSPGGFCTSSPVNDESRIFITFDGAFGDMSTLAHELGHGFHAWVMRGMRPWAQDYPMTLAESASTFAETLLTDAVLDAPTTGDREKAILLDRRLEEAAVYMLNIPMRYVFEYRLHEERAGGELSVSRLKEMMLEAQREWYGDTLDPNEMDPYFWASKIHFYFTGVSFYNFPYVFGFLLSLGLVARARREGPAFLPRYEEFLRLTGSDTCEGVAQRALGVDLGQPRFWLDSVALVEEDLRRFTELAPRVVGAAV